jgi:hypothetical protein
MKNVVLALAVAALAAGCAQSERVGAGGPHSDYAIECPSAQMEICLAEARRLCPRGYDVISMRRPDVAFSVIWRDRVVVRCET